MSLKGNKIKITILFALAVILVFSLATPRLVYASSNSDSASAKKQQIEENKKKEKELGEEASAIENKIEKTEEELLEMNDEIASTERKIASVNSDIKKIESQMNKQNEDLNSRLRVMYKNGDIGLLQVLLGSTSITDFMSNLDMIKNIHSSDVDILKSLEEQHKKIEAKKAELTSLKASIEAQRSEQKSIQGELEGDKNEVMKQKGKLTAENAQLKKELDAMNAEANRLSSTIPAMTDSTKKYEGGTFAWPVPGHTNISSPFGYRIHPILGVSMLHTGMDISAPQGATIVAAEAGTVIQAGWSGSYGNVIMIDHGSGIVTLYAHNSSLAVGTGTKVSRGQTIAYCGSTGRSTGPHCHFEVRVNGAYKDPMQWL